MATCWASAGESTTLDSAMFVNDERERTQHQGARQGQAERQPERAARGVHARRLADALLGDRRQRVVVELRHQQAQPGAGDDQRDGQPPAGIRAGHDREQDQDAQREQREAGADDARRAPVARPACRPASPRRTCSATAARATARPAARCTRAPSGGRSAARSSRRRARSAGASVRRCPAGRWTDANRSGSMSVSLPSRLRRTSHQANRTRDTAPMASRAPTAAPPSSHTRMPSTMPPMPSTDRTAPDDVDAARSRVGRRP